VKSKQRRGRLEKARAHARAAFVWMMDVDEYRLPLTGLSFNFREDLRAMNPRDIFSEQCPGKIREADR
jgi:hypothetical protein